MTNASRHRLPLAACVLLLLSACGGGGGGSAGGGCTPASTLQLTYKDARLPASQTSFSSGNEWFGSLEQVGLNPVFGQVCGADTTFRVVSGELPQGVTLDPDTGAIAGLPTSTGEFTPTIGLRVAGFQGEATRSLNFVVDDFGLDYTGGTTAPYPVGQVIAPLQPTVTDGFLSDTNAFRDVSNVKRGFILPADAVRSYAVVSGALPPGVTMDTAGVIRGTPTLAGTYVATIRLTASRNSHVQLGSSDARVSFLVQ
jgi:hypothetical protein